MSGKNLATAALVCSIVSLAIFLFGGILIILFPLIAYVIPLIGLILGIVAIVLSINAKKQGFTEGMQKAALAIAIISTILNGITFTACALCAAACNSVIGEFGGV